MSEEQKIVEKSPGLEDQFRINPSKEDIELMESSRYEMDSEQAKRWWNARNKSWKVNQICHRCDREYYDPECMGSDGFVPCMLWDFTQLSSEEQKMVEKPHELEDQIRANHSKEDIDLRRSSKYEMDSEEAKRWWFVRNKSWIVNLICHYCEQSMMDTQCKGTDGFDPCRLWEFSQL